MEKKYLLAISEYVKNGKDGFDAIHKGRVILDEENGPDLMLSIQNFLKTSQNEKYRKEYKLFNSDFKAIVEKQHGTGDKWKKFNHIKSKISIMGKLKASSMKDKLAKTGTQKSID